MIVWECLDNASMNWKSERNGIVHGVWGEQDREEMMVRVECIISDYGDDNGERM